MRLTEPCVSWWYMQFLPSMCVFHRRKPTVFRTNVKIVSVKNRGFPTMCIFVLFFSDIEHSSESMFCLTLNCTYFNLSVINPVVQHSIVPCFSDYTTYSGPRSGRRWAVSIRNALSSGSAAWHCISSYSVSSFVVGVDVSWRCWPSLLSSIRRCVSGLL